MLAFTEQATAASSAGLFYSYLRGQPHQCYRSRSRCACELLEKTPASVRAYEPPVASRVTSRRQRSKKLGIPKRLD
jgi:hypothetical protein